MELNSIYSVNYKGIYDKVKEQLSKQISNNQLIELEFSIGIALLSFKQNKKEKWKGYKLLNSIYLKRTEMNDNNNDDYLYLILKVVRHYRKKGKATNERYISNLKQIKENNLLYLLLPNELELLQINQDVIDKETKETIIKFDNNHKELIKDFESIKKQLNDHTFYSINNIINKSFLQKLISFIDVYFNENSTFEDKVKLFPGIIDNTCFVKFKDFWLDPQKKYCFENHKVKKIEDDSFIFIPNETWILITKYFKATNEKQKIISKEKVKLNQLLTFQTIILSKIFQNDDLLFLLKPRDLTIPSNITCHQLKEKIKRILNRYSTKSRNNTIKIYLYHIDNTVDSYERLIKLILAYKINLSFPVEVYEIQYDNHIRPLNNYCLIIEEVCNKNLVMTPLNKCIHCNKPLKEKIEKCVECSYNPYCSLNCIKDNENHGKFHSLFDQFFIKTVNGEKKDTSQITLMHNNTPNGRVGLENLGNTCYMNCVLQCLSNTKPLKNYILSLKLEKAQKEMNISEIVVDFYYLLRELWIVRKRYDSINPQKIRNSIMANFYQFHNSTMQDAHEFLFMLLDYFNSQLRVLDEVIKANEENESNKLDVINSNCQNKQIEESNNEENNGFIILNNFMNSKSIEDSIKKQNNFDKVEKMFGVEKSIIRDLFYGQLQSFIRCKTCGNKSINHEPFNCLSLPIYKEKKTIVFYFFSQDTTKEFESYQLDIFNETKLKTMKDKIIAKHPDSLEYNTIEALTYKSNKKTLTIMDNDVFVWEYFSKTSIIIFYEKESEKENGIYYYYSINNRHSDIFRLGLKDIASPLIDYLKIIKNRIRNIIKLNLENIPIKTVHNSSLCCFCHKSITQFQSCPIIEADNPVITYINKLKNYCLLVSIDLELKDFDTTLLDSSISKSSILNQNSDISIINCFNFFNSYEDIKDWKCPKCKQCNNAEKAIQIHSPPKYLILQLNRFKFQTGIMKYFKNKNNTLVEFPLNSLDIQDYVINKDNLQVYDLYGVINHLSWFSGFGHYIALCKNENNWIRYNDTKVELVSENEIVSSNAYLLFYEMRDSN